MMHQMWHWLLNDWTGGYLIGSMIGIIIHFSFRARMEGETLIKYGKRQVVFTMNTACRLLNQKEDTNYQEAITTMTAELLSIEPTERTRFATVLHAMAEENK